MRLAWIMLFFQILLISMLKQFINDTEILSIIMIGINMIFVIISLYKYNNIFRNIIYSAYIARLIILFWDVYARQVYVLPHSGGDTEGFYYYAELISKDLSLLSGYIYGNLYTKFLGLFFYIVGQERLLAQYINVLLGVSIIITVYKILCILNVNMKKIKNVVLIMAFFPSSIIFSGILLRENMVIFFLVLSFYYFTKWYKEEQFKFIINSLVFLLLASAFHSGVFAVVIGYFFMYMFYSHDKNKLTFKKSTVFIFVGATIISILLLTQFREFLLPSFSRIEQDEDLFKIANYRNGSAAYLKGLTINNLLQLILYSPIRMVYFLFSPLPMDWRGINDIISFFIDSIVYMALTIKILANSRKKYIKDIFLKCTIISLIATIFLFGIGVSNAGTAMRHRNKIFPLILICYAIIPDEKLKRKKI